MVINRDDARVEAHGAGAGAGQGRARQAGAPVERAACVRFGLDAPQRPGDFGLVVENGMAWLVRALPADETIKRRKGDEPRRSTCSA